MFNIEVWKEENEFNLLENHNYLLILTEKFFNNLISKKGNFLKNKKSRICGVMVPYLVANRKFIKEGALVFSPEEDLNYVVVSMDKPDLKLIDKIKDYKSIFLFVDGLSPYMESFTKQIENVIMESKVMGTGVGSKDFVQKPCIFDGVGVYQDSALLVGLNVELKVGVRHGWDIFYGPLVVTKSEKNVVYEINGEPAFVVYKRLIKEKEGIQVTPYNIQEIVKAYPLGMVSFKDDEIIIRDPIGIGKDNSLVIVSSIPPFSTIFIMTGHFETLIDSACKVSREVFRRSKGNIGILFDCVSRVLFLGEHGFTKEINNIFECAGKSNINIFGLTSIGEISNSGYNELRIFNKTILLGVVEEEI